MKIGTTFLYERKHFSRSPFKLIAVTLFLIAGIYGLQNGSHLYYKQTKEIERIHTKIQEERQQILSLYQQNGGKDKNRPWLNYNTPYWAVYNSWTYHFKYPSPAMVYSLGQSEQFGFYKRITMWANPYDADLVEEIANPERLQIASLDFSFVILYLTPLLLLILVFGIKSEETEQGLMPLVKVQTSNAKKWLFARFSFYILIIALIITILIIFGAWLTPIFETSSESFLEILSISFTYLLLWTIIFFMILLKGKSILGNILKMIGLFLLLTFIIPGAVQQYVTIKMPINLMIELIDVRDQEQELFSQPDSVLVNELVTLYPDIENSTIYRDSNDLSKALKHSLSALSNALKKESVKQIEKEIANRKTLIEATFWFNPISLFQNKLNRATNTHFTDYQKYKQQIQTLIDLQIATLINDTWNGIKIDDQRYERYEIMFKDHEYRF